MPLALNKEMATAGRALGWARHEGSSAFQTPRNQVQVSLCLVRAAQSDAMLVDASLLMPSASPLNVFKELEGRAPQP